jgi:hypothetical protein
MLVPTGPLSNINNPPSSLKKKITQYLHKNFLLECAQDSENYPPKYS